MTAIMKQENQPLATIEQSADSEVTQLIRLAIEKGQEPKELYAILKEERAARARQAYNQAISAFQNECPAVVEGRQSKISEKGFGYMWADFNDIVKVARPILSRHGLSFAHSVEPDPDGKPWMVCTMMHAAGHTQTTKVPFSEDDAGQMRGIQKMGSGLEYAKRYSLVLATGVRLIGVDDDGASTGTSDTITEEQCLSLNDALIDCHADVEAFKKMFEVAQLAELPATRLAEALAKIEAKKAKLGIKK